MRKLVVLLLLVLIACSAAQAPVRKESKAAIAMLAVQSGEVIVNGSPASAGMELKEGDSVKTGAKAKASVVFFDSSILRLNENTEIFVKSVVSQGGKKVAIEQTAGQTWSRVLKISGIKEYSIETPNTVATVRGTGFSISVGEGDTTIAVKEGKVHVASVDESGIVAEAVVPANMELEVTDEAPAELELAVLEPDPWVDENIIADDQFIDEIVEEYVEENSDEFAGVPEEEWRDHAEDIVMGGEQPIEEQTTDEIVDEMNADIVENAQEITDVDKTPAKETVTGQVEEVIGQLPEETLAEEAPEVAETPLEERLIDNSTFDPAASDLNTLI